MNDSLMLLIVDDDPDIAKFIKLKLLNEASHLRIETVESGQQCLDFIETNKVDCILSDYQMPGMDGMELLLSLRNKRNDTPFIFLTGQGNEEVAREAFKNGAFDYFTKDIGFAHFARIINSIGQAVRQRKAEEANKEELIFRHAIEDSVLSGIVAVDTGGRINYVNPAFCRMVGWTDEELIGAEPPFVYWPPEEIDKISEYFMATMRGEMQSRSLEMKFMRKNGERFDVLLLISGIKDSRGRAKGWMGAVYDITERKRIERELLESEAMFRNLTEDALAGVYLIQGGRFVYVNQKASQILGYPKEELLNLDNIYETVYPEDRETVRENVRRRLEGEMKTIDYEFRIMKKDGSFAIVEVLGSYTVCKDKPAVIGTIIDITERKRAEETTEKSRDYYRLLLDEFPTPVWQSGLDGKCIFFNKAWFEFTGRTLEQEIGDGWTEGVHPDDLPDCLKTYLSSFEERRKFKMEYRLRNHKGEYRTIIDVGSPIYDLEGTFAGYLGFTLDLTEEKKMEEALLESKERLLEGKERLLEERRKAEEELRNADDFCRNVMSCATNAIYSIDLKGRFTLINRQVCEITGYPEQELLGTPFSILFSPHDLVGVNKQFTLTVTQGIPVLKYETPLLRKDGSTVIIIFSLIPLLKAGEIAGVVGTAEDITEQKRAEEALRESEAKFKSLAEESLVGIYLIQDMRFVYVNPEFLNLLGYSEDELLQMDNMLDTVYPDDRELAGKGIDGVITGMKSSAVFQGRLLRKDGETIEVEGNSVVTIYNGRPAIIGTVLDVTERKNLEKQRTDFLAMITHDFKSPLTCILGFAELISTTKTDAGDKDTAEMAHSILESGEKLRSLVEDFLVQSKLDSKDIILELAPVEAYAILNEAKKEFAAQAAIKSLTVDIEAADNISKLYADRKLVQRAFFNLFENAVNYTPAGGTITVRAENRLEKDQTFVVVSVTDTGPGIPVYEQKRIFDKYYRLSRTSRIKGTGLGLAIVKAVAEAHGGRVEVESEVGMGSTFRLYIPVSLKKKEAA